MGETLRCDEFDVGRVISTRGGGRAAEAGGAVAWDTFSPQRSIAGRGVAGGGGEGGQKILELPSMEVTRAMDFLLVAERKFRRSGRTVLDGQGRGGRGFFLCSLP
jgi:hypothetical protein